MQFHSHRIVVLSVLVVAKAMNEEQRIAVCRTGVRQLYRMFDDAPQTWRTHINLARSIMTHLDATTFMQQSSRTTEQAWVIAGLQRLAYMDSDTLGIPDIVAWCARNWLSILQREPEQVSALQGIGQSWLSRAQPVLARIHRGEGSSSSSGDSSSRPARSRSNENEDGQDPDPRTEAERRTDSQDYVEARQYLQPATEYLERAVKAATAQDTVTGDLLSAAAEANMSLGNVSNPRTNEQYFQSALRLLQRAAALPDYALSRYLQQYLDDYGRLLD